MRPVKIEFLRSLYTSMDEYEALDQWKQSLRQTSVAYCAADDTIKELAAQLKPLRLTVKDCGAQVIELLQQRNERRCDLHDHKVSLKLDVRNQKRMPSKAQIRERCLQFTGDETKGEELFAFLLNPEVKQRTRLMRKKLTGTIGSKPFTAGVNEMLEALEAEEDDESNE